MTVFSSMPLGEEMGNHVCDNGIIVDECNGK
jgi:hypothetical protein